MKTHAIAWTVALTLTGSQLGCGGMLRDAAREATPAVVSGAVEGLARPETQRELLVAAEPGQVRKLSGQLTAGVVDGALDTLEDPGRRQRIAELSNRLVEGGLMALDTPEHRARLEALVARTTSTAVGAAVDTTLSRALDERTQLRVRSATKAAVTELVRAAFEAARSEVGSAAERDEAVGALAHEVAKGATLGFQAAIDQAARERASGAVPKGEGALLAAVGEAPTTGSRIVGILAAGLSIIALVLATGLVWAIRKNRARRAELEQRDEALRVLTEAMQSNAAEAPLEERRVALPTPTVDAQGGAYVRRAPRERYGPRARRRRRVPSVAAHSFEVASR
jgi:hypothetical protein